MCVVAQDGKYAVGYASVELRREDWAANLSVINGMMVCKPLETEEIT